MSSFPGLLYCALHIRYWMDMIMGEVTVQLPLMASLTFKRNTKQQTGCCCKCHELWKDWDKFCHSIYQAMSSSTWRDQFQWIHCFISSKPCTVRTAFESKTNIHAGQHLRSHYFQSWYRFTETCFYLTRQEIPLWFQGGPETSWTLQNWCLLSGSVKWTTVKREKWRGLYSPRVCCMLISEIILVMRHQ